MLQASVEGILEGPVKELVEGSLEDLIETSVGASVEELVEAPVEGFVELPVAAPEEGFVEAPVEGFVEALVEAPGEGLVDTPVEAQVEALVEASVEELLEATSSQRCPFTALPPFTTLELKHQQRWGTVQLLGLLESRSMMCPVSSLASSRELRGDIITQPYGALDLLIPNLPAYLIACLLRLLV